MFDPDTVKTMSPVLLSWNEQLKIPRKRHKSEKIYELAEKPGKDLEFCFQKVVATMNIFYGFLLPNKGGEGGGRRSQGSQSDGDWSDNVRLTFCLAFSC